MASAPVSVGAFARWCASARLDAALAADPELQSWHSAQLSRPADISLDGLEAEPPQQLLLRRVREEVEVVVESRGDEVNLEDVPDVRELDLTGVSLAETALHDLPLNHGLPLEQSQLESVRRMVQGRAEQKRTARGREVDSLSAALSRKRARADADGAAADGRAPPRPEDLLAHDEVILRVAFFHARRAAKLRELLVTGSQTLGDLRDRLRCDVERLVEQVAEQRSLGSELPTRASAFLIGGAFYTDEVDGVDVSAGLRAWMRAADPDGRLCASDEQPRPMRSARLRDLTVELGAQCLFVHLGECEHVLAFTDLWARTSDDEQLAAAYPLLLYEARPKLEVCIVCKQHAARHLTVGGDSYLVRLGVENPSRYCEHCYHAVHYGPDERLLHDDFRTYEIPHESLELGVGEDDEAEGCGEG